MPGVPSTLKSAGLRSSQVPHRVDEVEADTQPRPWTSLGSGTGCALLPKPLFSLPRQRLLVYQSCFGLLNVTRC